MTNLKDRILTFLNHHCIEYKLYQHESALSIEHVSQMRNLAEHMSMKTLMFKSKNQFFLFSIRGHKKMDSKRIRKILKTHRLSFASKEKLFDYSGAIPGTLPPLGEPIINLPLFVDSSIDDYELVAFTLGSLEESISFSTKDYLRIVNFKKEEFALQNCANS